MVICVDNASSDGTVEAVRAEFPDVEVVETGANLGFAGGNNAGIRHALDHGARWVVLLNNDAELAADAVDAFERASRERPRAGVLGGKLLFADRPDRIWFAGQRFNAALGYSWRPRGYGRRDGPRYAGLRDTERAAGALMAVSREAIESAGFMDEELFLYVEDVDWCLRIRAAGFEVVMVGDARAWHRVSAASGGERQSTQALYYGARNTVVVAERQRPFGRLGTTARRVVIGATFGLYALTRADRRRALGLVRSGLRDARGGHLGQRR